MGHDDDAAPLLDGRYRIEGAIGQGGMSVVYRATDEVLHRPVAVKLFHPGSVDIARQESELGVLAALEHHNLVGLLDAGVVTGADGGSQRFIVMSLILGQDLEARLSVGPLASRHIAEIGYDMAEALDYIHAHGVVHRDIKPSNILLVDYGNGSERARARLTDFGIALAAGVERLTADGVTTGTAAYLSPEQARGADVGPASDVYSLGLVLLQCFTRRREFPGSLVESAIARLSRDPVVPEPLPERWKHLLRAMTAQDPSARPLGGQLVAMLRDVLIAETADEAASGSAGPAVAEPAGRSTPDTADGRTGTGTGTGTHRHRHRHRHGRQQPARHARHAARGVPPAHRRDGRPALRRADRPGRRARRGPRVVALLDRRRRRRGRTEHQLPERLRTGARARRDPGRLRPPGDAAEPARDRPLGIRFYVSVPMLRHDGTAVGTLAVLDVRPREATEADLANLRDLAALAVTQLELRQETLRTTSDSLPIDSGRPVDSGRH